MTLKRKSDFFGNFLIILLDFLFKIFRDFWGIFGDLFCDFFVIFWENFLRILLEFSGNSIEILIEFFGNFKLHPLLYCNADKKL